MLIWVFIYGGVLVFHKIFIVDIRGNLSLWALSYSSRYSLNIHEKEKSVEVLDLVVVKNGLDQRD